MADVKEMETSGIFVKLEKKIGAFASLFRQVSCTWETDLFGYRLESDYVFWSFNRSPHFIFK